MLYLLSAFSFLLNIILGLLITLLGLRFLLQLNRTPYSDSLGINQFVYLSSQPIIKPFNRFIPRWRSIELAPPMLMWVGELILHLFSLFISDHSSNLIAILSFALGNVIETLIYIFMLSFFIQVIMSFIDPYHPIYRFSSHFNSPLSRPIQQRLPPVNGMDFSVLIAMILLQLGLILLVAPLKGGF